MARDKSKSESARRMLSLWDPPAHAGAPVGVLATTFTLDTALFEEECLARFAGVQSDPTRDGALYRIEREERLASLLCAAVVADVHHCGGRRSLRWDLLAARPKSGVMHAKISLLVWSSHVRVIVASANLTSEGYRRNQECASVLDFNEDFADRDLLDPLVVYLREVLATTKGPARERATRLLDWVIRELPRSIPPARGLQRRVLLVGPGRENLFKQLNTHLPSTRPYEAHVVSPFFDGALGDQGPEAEIWEMLRQRGDATLHMHVSGEHAPETGHWRLHAPAYLLDSVPRGRAGATMELHPVRVNDATTDGGPERRPLHAKMLTLHHPSWIAWVVGSSNFTSAGTGLSPRARNYEANVLYFVRTGQADPLYREIELRGLRGGDAVDVGVANIEFAPCFGEEDGEGERVPPLPPFFAEAELIASTDEHYVLTLRFGVKPVSRWWITRESIPVCDHAGWFAAEEPALLEMALPRTGPPPSLLQVEWENSPGLRHVADWPVNVRTATVLPPPEELRGLSLAALLELLSSARPLHEAMRSWLRRQPDDDDPDGLPSAELVDPHQKVDTSGFLIKRVQRACGALRSLRERLELPVLSDAALAWRIDGPVGARAVVDAMRRQCDPTLPDEWAFLLCELIRELEPVALSESVDRPVEASLQKQLDTFVEALSSELEGVLSGASESLRSYAAVKFGEERHAVA